MPQELPPGFQLDNGPAPAPAAPRAPGVIQGRPKAPPPPAQPAPTRETEVFTTLTPEQARARGLPEGGVYQVNAAGKVDIIQAPPKSRDGGAISVAAANTVRPGLGAVTALQRALDTFNPDYVGNLAGGLENTLQSYTPEMFGTVGTPGQADWWADFRRTDNLERNELFGATLTPGEKQAYAQTTITPGMNAREARANIERRLEIVRGALEREKEFYLANGYKPEAVEALFAPLKPRQISAGDANSGDGEGLDGIRITDESRRDSQGRILFDEQGNMLMEGQDYSGPTFYDDGSEGPLLGRVTDDSPATKGYGSSERGAFLVLEDGSVLTGYDDQGAPIYRPYTEGMEADPRALQMRRQMGFDESIDAFRTITGRAGSLGIGDEFAGIGGAIGAALRGEDVALGFEAGQQGELRRGELASQQYGPVGTLALELLTGGAGGRAVNGVRAGLNTARRLAASGAPISRNALQGALTRRSGAVGAAIGGTAGAANGETLQDRGVNALIGASGGAFLGAGGQSLSNRLSNRAAPSISEGAAAMQAADRLGIEPIPAVTRGTTTRVLTSGAKQGFISARPIDKAVTRMEGQAEAARGRASQSAGQAVNDEDAGELVRKGAQVFSARTSQIGGNLYDRADRMARGAKVPLPNAVRALDEEIAALDQSPTAKGSALLKELRTLRDQVANGEFSIAGIRAMRTDLREQIVARGLRQSPSDRIYNRVLQASEDDAINGLRERGLDNAAGAMQTARDFWRKRVETIDEVLDPLIGKNAPRSGEQILASLERMARPDSGNSANLRRLMQAMPKGEAAAVRATVINRLGRSTAGSANVDREGFSFDTFLTNWNNMSPRARATMFPPESIAALNDLATVSQAVKRAGSSANRSNTAGALAVQGALSTAGVWFLEPMTAISATGGQYAIGKLLASPKVARLLARAPRQDSPAARRSFAARLGNLAQAEPSLAREIGIYQRTLVANDNNAIGSVAAENEDQQPR
jgi:hypothetical protein